MCPALRETLTTSSPISTILPPDNQMWVLHLFHSATRDQQPVSTQYFHRERRWPRHHSLGPTPYLCADSLVMRSFHAMPTSTWKTFWALKIMPKCSRSEHMWWVSAVQNTPVSSRVCAEQCVLSLPLSCRAALWRTPSAPVPTPCCQ